MKKGIYCLEGLWSSSVQDKSSVQPVLQLIENLDICKNVYHSCATRDELYFFLNKYKVKATQSKYPILYFAFHGSKEHILLAGKQSVSLDELGELLEDSCKGKVFFFASCETLNVDERKIKTFLGRTGAIAALGYKSEVDWMQATAFELLVLDALQDDRFDSKGILKIKDFIEKEYSYLTKKLKYRMVVNDKVHFPRKRK